MLPAPPRSARLMHILRATQMPQWAAARLRWRTILLQSASALDHARRRSLQSASWLRFAARAACAPWLAINSSFTLHRVTEGPWRSQARGCLPAGELADMYEKRLSIRHTLLPHLYVLAPSRPRNTRKPRGHSPIKRQVLSSLAISSHGEPTSGILRAPTSHPGREYQLGRLSADLVRLRAP